MGSQNDHSEGTGSPTSELSFFSCLLVAQQSFSDAVVHAEIHRWVFFGQRNASSKAEEGLADRWTHRKSIWVGIILLQPILGLVMGPSEPNLPIPMARIQKQYEIFIEKEKIIYPTGMNIGNVTHRPMVQSQAMKHLSASWC